MSQEPGLIKKALWSVRHGVEQTLFSENFVIADLSPYDVIHADGIMSVRHYQALLDAEIEIAGQTVTVEEPSDRIPVLLVPPLAATSMIFDLMPHRSIVRYFLARGFDVYLVDWGDVTADHSNLSLESYVMEWMPDVVDSVLGHASVKELSIFSYCMGGLLSLMYLATSGDQRVRNLITVASPVDMHQSGLTGKFLSVVYKPAQSISSMLNVSLLDMPAKMFHVPGWVSSVAFKLTNPIGSVINSYEKFLNLWDREYLEESLTMSKWFDDMVDYPGETIKDMAVHMMINNRIASGAMRIGQAKAQFNKIACSILAFAGESDNIVSVKAAHKILDIVSSTDKEFCIAPGGHAGVFAGASAPAHTWALSADWLVERSDKR
ncbi:alpha/beta hydrolase [Oleiphilus sp. HI0071]|uniref:alpha/beta fold hydrolase n=2 Tax=Oleiphilus TaxID=141450 RepID=UPI0007C2947C|nr:MULTISPECIES: alpha/beta fold hydrolase [unclassified Oleiphilus]KZY70167.1 alpha/beta hydrolase [Oleiphilus sp. HI0065]KZY83365.1 alpha/beta hydrolase [Oleiphilus sp. HI0071]KZY91035.1 alpha/beta hydrolase [Oleiphilus sp. HI0073]KZZ42057.1 alpha/beta hydrolase [Oleiphilus sp. HI0118]KZZ60494.1 alpha/beta hydrolase [Oleiphilus sp. HI0122]KZZ66841.1 alpha/beta hydrolase [Oleiphilus sp. HI0130]KZZ81234.1 alpha/beta hydrolase [Oleiphilus sp. HI0133]